MWSRAVDFFSSVVFGDRMPPKKRKRPAADSEMASESESKRRASHAGSWLRSGTQRDDSVHGDVSLGEYAKLLNAAAPPSQSTRYRSPSKSKRANSLNTQTALTAEVTSSSAAAAAVSNAAVSPVEDIALSAKGTKAPRALGSVSSISTTPSGGSTTLVIPPGACHHALLLLVPGCMAALRFLCLVTRQSVRWQLLL